MAVQSGLGVSKLLILGSAGYTGTILLQNGKLADLLSEIQNVLQKHGESEGDSDALAAQVHRLAMEIRHLASARSITVVNGDSGRNGLASLIVPAATAGALGYGYMWWKGISFLDLMYVTKKNMATAVANLTKHMEHVSDALAATKKHLTQRIENLDDKLDSQVQISKEIRSKVAVVSGCLSQTNCNLDELHRIVSSIDGKLLRLESKQDKANHGVAALCAFVSGKPLEFNEKFKAQYKIVGSSVPALTGLKEVVYALELEAKDNR